MSARVCSAGVVTHPVGFYAPVVGAQRPTACVTTPSEHTHVLMRLQHAMPCVH
jgi:hypothetical protein